MSDKVETPNKWRRANLSSFIAACPICAAILPLVMERSDASTKYILISSCFLFSCFFLPSIATLLILGTFSTAQTEPKKNIFLGMCRQRSTQCEQMRRNARDMYLPCICYDTGTKKLTLFKLGVRTRRNLLWKNSTNYIDPNSNEIQEQVLSHWIWEV